MDIFDEIISGGHRTEAERLSPWFEARLRAQIDAGRFPSPASLREAGRALVERLRDYRKESGISVAVVGMSGGVDSALTAALLKDAGWRVIGATLPVNQDPEETEKGSEACAALGLEQVHLDLSQAHGHVVAALDTLDAGLAGRDDAAARTRRGNLAARLRMSALYDQAHRHGGIVVSTDNFSERGAGFWTLHGDVGDLAPLQALLKSWEVPFLARAYGVPERIYRSRPTDGLGIGGGDEEQIGVSYLQWDVAVFALLEAAIAQPQTSRDGLLAALEFGGDDAAREAVAHVADRIGATWFKRVSPIEFDHPHGARFGPFDALEARLFRPASVRSPDDALVKWSADISELAAGLAGALSEGGQRLVVAESCTAGLLGAALAAAPGSSGFLEGTILAYTPDLKTDLLGVSAATLKAHTPYSAEVAEEMAAGALGCAPAADMALATTGVGGPDDDQGVPAGRVYVTVQRRGGDPVTRRLDLSGRPQEVLAGAVRGALLQARAL